MIFNTLNDVPPIIKEFYFEDERGELQIEREGEHKTLSDLERVIALGRGNANTVLAKFAPMVEQGRRWDWFQSYLEFLTASKDWQEASDEFIPVETVEGSGVFTEFVTEEPVAPVRPLTQTTEEILAPYWGSRRSKLLEDATITTTLGNQYDADELSINRLTMAIVALTGQPDTYAMPWSLANTGTGVMTMVTLKDLKEAQALAAANMSTIWSNE